MLLWTLRCWFLTIVSFEITCYDDCAENCWFRFRFTRQSKKGQGTLASDRWFSNYTDYCFFPEFYVLLFDWMATSQIFYGIMIHAGTTYLLETWSARRSLVYVCVILPNCAVDFPASGYAFHVDFQNRLSKQEFEYGVYWKSVTNAKSKLILLFCRHWSVIAYPHFFHETPIRVDLLIRVCLSNRILNCSGSTEITCSLSSASRPASFAV